MLVADDEGVLVGICTAYQDLHSVRYGYRAWVEDLAVDPERRSRGVGKALMDAAKEWARERGATHLELDSALARTDAHRFYEREGAEYKSVQLRLDPLTRRRLAGASRSPSPSPRRVRRLGRLPA